MIDRKSIPSAEQIANAACARYGVSWGQVVGTGRSPYETAARGQIAAIIREWHGWSWPEIGRFMGRTGHSSAFMQATGFWRSLEESLK